MRRVYTPPSKDSALPLAALSGLALALAVFLVLPFTQIASDSLKRKFQIAKVETTVLPPPPENILPPPPPPPEDEPEEPKPELQDLNQTMQLAIPDLDLAVGTGGVLGGSDFPGNQMVNPEQLSAFDLSDLDKQPSVISSVSPAYPRELLRGKVEGNVVLVFVVDENGRVEDPRVENSTHPDFEKPALEAVRRWRFQPGSKEGAAVKSFMRLPMRFRINS
ncbi:MAG: energy transducer TonB [Limisphaerales bacterium]